MAFRGSLNHSIISQVDKVCYATANRLTNYSQQKQIYEEKNVGVNAIATVSVC